MHNQNVIIDYDKIRFSKACREETTSVKVGYKPNVDIIFELYL